LINNSGYQRLLISAFLVIATLIVSAVFVYQEKAHEHEALLTLEAISDLKVRQIDDWRSDQLIFAEAASNDPYLRNAAARWALTDDARLSSELRAWLRNSRRYSDAADLVLVDLDNWRVLSTSSSSGVKPEFRSTVELAVKNRRAVMSDLHLDGHALPHIDVAAPILIGHQPARLAVVLQIDAAKYLFPLVQSWPLSSASAETLLARRDGNAALFLNELRHRKNTALKFRVSFARSNVIAVQALSAGRRGLVSGVDYRGVPVLANIAAIPGTSWIMVAKIDRREAMADWTLSRNLLVLVLALVAMVGLLLIKDSFERDRRFRLEKLLAQERIRRAADERYAAVTRCISDGMITFGSDGRIDLINAAACGMIGCLPEDAIGRDLCDILFLADIETGQALVDGSAALLNSCGGMKCFLLSASGARRPVSLSTSCISGTEFDGCILTVTDIHEDYERQREKELTIKVLSLITGLDDLHALIRELTALLREWTGCEAVGIRLKDKDGDYPYFETCGFPARFVELERQLCSRDLDGQICRDDCGNPLLECMCGNIIRGQFNPELNFFTKGGSFWTNSTSRLLAETSEADRQSSTRNRCINEGYESVALIRLRHGGVSLGLLQFNDKQPGRFTPELIAFLEGCADQIALALKQRQIYAELVRSEARWRQLVETANEGIWSMNGRHETVFVNDRMLEILGYSREEIMSVPVENFIYDNDLEYHKKEMQARRSKHPGRYERSFRHKDGHAVTALVSAMPLTDDDGNYAGSFAMLTDITDRRRAESELAQSRDLLDASQKLAGVGGWEWNLETGVMYWTDETYAIHGLERGQLESGSDSHIARSLDCYDHDDRPIVRSAFERCVSEGLAYDLELPFTSFAGRRLWIRTTAEAFWSQGRIAKVIGTLSDVTNRKQSEDALRVSEEKFHRAFRDAPMLITISNLASGQYLDVNDRFVNVSGFSATDAIGKTAAELGLVTPEERDAIHKMSGGSACLDRNPESISEALPGII